MYYYCYVSYIVFTLVITFLPDMKRLTWISRSSYNTSCAEKIKTFRENLTLLWRLNGRKGVSNHQPHDCLLKRLFRHRSKKTSKLHFTDLCAGNSTVTGAFPTQRASNAENDSIWWRHHDHPHCNRLTGIAQVLLHRGIVGPCFIRI